MCSMLSVMLSLALHMHTLPKFTTYCVLGMEAYERLA